MMSVQDFSGFDVYANETQPLFVEVEVEVERVPEDASACIADYFKAIAIGNSPNCDVQDEDVGISPNEYLERAHFHCRKILAVHYYDAADEVMKLFAGDDLSNVDNSSFAEEREKLRKCAFGCIRNFSEYESSIQKQLIRKNEAFSGDECAIEREASKDPLLRESVTRSYEASKQYYEYIKESIPRLNNNHFQRDRMHVLHTWQGKAGLVTFVLGILAIIHSVMRT